MKYLLTLITTLVLATQTWAYSVEQAKADLKQGRYAESANQLRQLVKEDASNYEAWFLFGVSLVHEHQYHQAIEAFRQVIALRPDLAEPHNNLAAVYNNLGDTQAAVRELEIALDKRPNYTIAEENLADLYIKLALKHYRNVLKTSSNPVLEQRYARLIQVRNPMDSKQPETPATPSKAASTPPEPTPQPLSKPSPKPAPQPTKAQVVSQPTIITPKPAEPVAQSIEAVLDALEAWREAWASQNLDAYFASYSPQFQPPARFANRAAWEAYKKRVIGNKRFIRIAFEQVEVNLSDDKNTAIVKLLQRFQSDTYNGQDFKKISFVYTPQGWKIVAEESVK